VQALLHDGRNVLRVYVPAGAYVVQIKELVPWSERKASFHVQGTITSGSKQVATVSEDFDLSSSKDHQGVTVYLNAPRGYLDISIDYSSKTEGVPVFLVFGPMK
jgi:hypothetical protein